MDVSNLCRGCMTEVASWEKENFHKTAVDMFSFCTSIQIIDDENLPKQFCCGCMIKIESAYTFIKKAQNVNITLRNIISQSDINVGREHSKRLESHENPIGNGNKTLPDHKHFSTLGSSSSPAHANDLIEDYLTDQEEQTEYDDLDDIEDLIPLTNLPIEAFNIDEQEKGEKVANDAEKKNVCPICKKSFRTAAWFDKHMRKEIAGQRLKCEQCPKTFKRQSDLAYHAVSHSDERNFLCKVCGKTFKLRKQLLAHSRGHGEARPYACEKCPMRFKTKTILMCHMKVHADKKAYLCSTCGSCFSQACNLAVHVRTHTGDKPYACAWCDFRTASASSVRRHERRHRDARDFVCKYCDKGFFDTSAVARHERTHTGELPYQCASCTRTFADSWKRKLHIMRAHRQDLRDVPRLRRDGQPVVTS